MSRLARKGKAVASGQVVTAICSIGDENVTFVYHAPSAALGDAQASLAPHSLARGFTYPDGYRETERFADIVEQARLYIMTDCGGSFERFAEWGLIRAFRLSESRTMLASVMPNVRKVKTATAGLTRI